MTMTKERQLSLEEMMGQQDEKAAPVGQSKDDWIGADQVFCTGGLAWAVDPTGRTFCLGVEVKVREVLKAGKLPEWANPAQRQEFIRIFELQKEIELDGKGIDIQRPGTIRSRVAREAKHRAAHIKPASFRKRLPGSKA